MSFCGHSPGEAKLNVLFAEDHPPPDRYFMPFPLAPSPETYAPNFWLQSLAEIINNDNSNNDGK